MYLNSHAGVENSAVKMRYKKGDIFMKLDDVRDFLIGLVLFIAGATLGIFLFLFGLQNNII